LRIGHQRTKSDENGRLNRKQRGYGFDGMRAEVWEISASAMEGIDILTKMFSEVKEE
jgi:hypothetical protein